MIKRVFETVHFKLVDQIEEIEFIAEIEATKPFLAELEGFVKRSVGKSSNGVWIDMFEWESESEFISLVDTLHSMKEMINYVDMIDTQTITSQSYELEARFLSI